MKLRDLSDKEINKLQKRCMKEFKDASSALEDLGRGDAWKTAWSNGLKAGLEFPPDKKWDWEGK